MTRILTNPNIIDESVAQLAEYFGAILVDRTVDKAVAITKLFGDFSNYLKANVITFDGDEDDDVSTRSTRTPSPNDIDDQNVLDPKLEAMIGALIEASPASLTRQQAVHHLLHSPRGRLLASHIANITKKEQRPMVDITKLHNIESVVVISKHIIDNGASGISEHEFSQMIMGHAKLNKRANESDTAAFARIFSAPENIELRKAHAITQSSFPNMMDTTPVTVETGSTLVSDDSAKAYEQLMALAEKQHRTFEQVFSDPANGELAGRTYTLAHRPNVSSTSGSELQR
jgi:hypothetical protein